MPATEPARAPDFLYGTAWKEDRTPALTELALRAGFRGIDTANQRRHYFEAGVGQALAAAYRAGLVTRADLFLQTKFTYEGGQDHRLPYDPAAPLSTQVAQSMASSLEHLGTDHVDSYVLHGPASGYGWTEHDAEVWAAMVKERDGGRTRMLGVSNVSLRHLDQMMATGAETPAFVQNRCFARVGWDRDVRAFCREHSAAQPQGRRDRRALAGDPPSGRLSVRARGGHAAADRDVRRQAHAAGSREPRPRALGRRRVGHRAPGRLRPVLDPATRRVPHP
jgi:diketogulonate reductase-like aldo/keto reductase